ncbi:amidohydrolase [Frankia sp. CcI49]|uniref:amidohydrolase family protein n=1 Tax=unclassified Frankia TaxID=2632575 RepID=UPI0006CA2500|nr:MULTISPECIES: amidohydrolase family protein [unclassified Frankia]KPM54359.1 amidohydrolase [Frankia sp. R43]ONH58758.1 amidohydrolase [Frankia sp. CcI49]
MTDLDLDWLISVDDHVLEPPHVWQSRMPAKFRDAAPRLVTDGDLEFWVFEGKRVPTSGLSAVVGKGKDYSPEAIRYADMAPGCYDPVARVADMDVDGVLASLCFPSFPRFCGQIFWEASDKELALEGVRAYNDWMIDEWCGAAPGRLIPLVIMPLWDPRLAARELERVAAKGARAVAFSENPAPLGLPTIHDPARYWDPVFAAAQDLELVVCMHVGSSSQLSTISPDSPVLANLSFGSVRTAGAMLEWIFSGVFQRFPNLKIALSEGNMGWIPFFLQRAEQVIHTQRAWATKGVSFDPMPGSFPTAVNPDLDLMTLDPWETFRRHIYGCFIDDAVGLANLQFIGEDNIMIETDYPHSDSTWPHSRKLARERMAHLPAETQYKILRGNAERLFRFTPAEPPALP